MTASNKVSASLKVSTNLKDGMISGLPIVIGYFPVAVAFGLLAKTVHISFIDTCLFSIIVFAGASQFMALDLIKAGIATGDIILATFLLNLRHLMMSASLSIRLKEIKKRWLPFITFGVTDETFSVSSMKGGNLNAQFLFALHGISYASWVLGTITGYLAGSNLPVSLQSSLGVGLYAMFAALLIPETKKSSNILILALISGAIYLIIDYFELLQSGWSLITTIVVASGTGVILLKDDMTEEQA